MNQTAELPIQIKLPTKPSTELPIKLPKVRNYLKKWKEIVRDQDGQIRLVEHRELGVATSTKQRPRRDDMICKDRMGEKVKNKNLKLKTGVNVKENDKITDKIAEEIEVKNSDKIHGELKPKVSDIINNFEKLDNLTGRDKVVVLKNRLSLRKKLSFEEMTEEKKKKAEEDQEVVKL